jgi:hypothetical protein
MSMKKQPEGIVRRARDKSKPPWSYDIRWNKALIGASQRMPKGKWRMWPVALLSADPDTFELASPETDVPGAQIFSDHTDGLLWLIGIAEGKEATTEQVTVVETEGVVVQESSVADPEGTLDAGDEAETQAILNDPDTMHALAEGVAEGVAEEDPEMGAALHVLADSGVVAEPPEHHPGDSCAAPAVPDIPFTPAVGPPELPWNYPTPDPQPGATQAASDFWESIGQGAGEDSFQTE